MGGPSDGEGVTIWTLHPILLGEPTAVSPTMTCDQVLTHRHPSAPARAIAPHARRPRRPPHGPRAGLRRISQARVRIRGCRGCRDAEVAGMRRRRRGAARPVVQRLARGAVFVAYSSSPESAREVPAGVVLAIPIRNSALDWVSLSLESTSSSACCCSRPVNKRRRRHMILS